MRMLSKSGGQRLRGVQSPRPIHHSHRRVPFTPKQILKLPGPSSAVVGPLHTRADAKCQASRRPGDISQY